VDSPWTAAPAYDLSNYLFNFIYSSTNLCGEAFYSCGKLLKLIFFTAFALLIFSVAVRFMPFWAAFTVLVALYLSPISIYVSMYLPESLYFALLALAFWLLVRLLESENRMQWTLVGGALGLAALAKPHALFSVAAFGIFLIIWELSRRSNLKTMFKSALIFGGGFLAVRILVGLAVAGPKALNLFGSYGAAGAVGEFVTGAGPVAGAVALFLPQISTHFLVLTALLGGVLALIILAVIESVRKSDRSVESSLAILMLVWIGVLLIVVALFTGWITGNGDDHTSRVLLRYYEFLIPMAIIPALSFLFSKSGYLESKLWSRLAATAALFVASSLAFKGFLSQLQIQIADAPSVAGLISDADIWNLVGVASVVGVLALAFFPRVASYLLVGTPAVTMVGTGWVTQTQYLDARGNAN
jgi:phosphoglycerol transferase